MTISTKIFKIAIDGHAASGKSTSAKRIAELLNFDHINSGNIYRALTSVFLKKFKENEFNGQLNDQMIFFLENINFEIKNNKFYTDNEEIELRTEKVDNFVCHLATCKKLRGIANKIQKELINSVKRGVVMDGRDIASSIMPDADLKIFMTASPEKRASRRLLERQSGNFDDILEEINKRDYLDENRKFGPLVQTPDSFLIENNNLSFDDQVKLIIAEVEKIRNK